MLTHRLVPAAGGVPKPGESAHDAPWQRELGEHEVALFCFDAATGQPLTLAGKPAQSPIQQYAVVYPTRRAGEVVMRRLVVRDPRLRVSLYDRRGTLVATMTRDEAAARGTLLGMPRSMVDFAVMAAAGAAGFFVATSRHGLRLGAFVLSWHAPAPDQRMALAAAAVAAGLVLAYAVTRVRRALAAGAAARAARPMSPARRERLYEELAKRPVTLLPAEITLQSAFIVWSDPIRYGKWERALGAAGCARLDRYRIPELGAQLEFWLDEPNELAITVTDHPNAGMWVSATTRYDDGTAYAAANLKAPAVDQNPRFHTEYLGPDATAEDVIAHARDDRPPGPRRHPTPDNVLEDYRMGWRDGMRWRRERGVTADEYRRADAERQARAATA